MPWYTLLRTRSAGMSRGILSRDGMRAVLHPFWPCRRTVASRMPWTAIMPPMYPS